MYIFVRKNGYLKTTHKKSKQNNTDIISFFNYSKTLMEILLINQLRYQLHGKYYSNSASDYNII